MPADPKILSAYLDLARVAQQRGKPYHCDKFLLLAAATAAEMQLWDLAERCRRKVLEHNRAHLVAGYDSFRSALQDEDFQVYLRRLKREWPYEKAEHVLTHPALRAHRDQVADDEDLAARYLGLDEPGQPPLAPASSEESKVPEKEGEWENGKKRASATPAADKPTRESARSAGRHPSSQSGFAPAQPVANPRVPARPPAPSRPSDLEPPRSSSIISRVPKSGAGEPKAVPTTGRGGGLLSKLWSRASAATPSTPKIAASESPQMEGARMARSSLWPTWPSWVLWSGVLLVGLVMLAVWFVLPALVL